MGAPVILLFIFLGRAVSLEGASDGIDEYIRDSNWDALNKTPQVWALATSQIFFSRKYIVQAFFVVSSAGVALVHKIVQCSLT